MKEKGQFKKKFVKKIATIMMAAAMVVSGGFGVAPAADHSVSVYATDNAYEGYNFPKPHYLGAIPVSEIILTSQNSDASTSTIYQNPGWPSQSVGTADYSYDCD